MNWPLLVSFIVVVGSWSAFLSGTFDIPGWEGFGKGLAIGSLAGTAPIISAVMNLLGADSSQEASS
jgi:hypothetical protein